MTQHRSDRGADKLIAGCLHIDRKPRRQSCYQNISLSATLVAALLFLLISVAPAATAQEQELGPYSFPETVMPMPGRLQRGEYFEGYPQLRIHVGWTAIPSWLAGVWFSKSLRILSTFDHQKKAIYTQPTSRRTAALYHMGDLRDARGAKWHALISPEVLESVQGNQVDSENIIATKLVSAGPQMVAIWTRSWHVIYDSHSHQILDAFTEEKVIEFHPTNSGMVVAKIFSRLYDPGGNPIVSTMNVRACNLNQKFQPAGQRSGVNLYISLADHLQDLGRSDLINW